MALKLIVFRLHIFQILEFFFVLCNQVRIFSFHFKLHINDVVSSGLLLDENILTESLNWSERTEVGRKFLTHLGLLLVKLQIVHHDFEHSLLLFVGFHFLFKFKAMGFKILHSGFVQFKMINLTRSNLVGRKLISMNLSLDILIALSVPLSKLLRDLQTFQFSDELSLLLLVLVSLENHLVDEFKQGHSNVRIFKSETLEKCLESNTFGLCSMSYSSFVDQVKLFRHGTLGNIEEDTDTLLLRVLVLISQMEELF